MNKVSGINSLSLIIYFAIEIVQNSKSLMQNSLRKNPFLWREFERFLTGTARTGS